MCCTRPPRGRAIQRAVHRGSGPTTCQFRPQASGGFPLWSASFLSAVRLLTQLWVAHCCNLRRKGQWSTRGWSSTRRRRGGEYRGSGRWRGRAPRVGPSSPQPRGGAFAPAPIGRLPLWTFGPHCSSQVGPGTQPQQRGRRRSQVVAGLEPSQPPWYRRAPRGIFSESELIVTPLPLLLPAPGGGRDSLVSPTVWPTQ